MWFLYYLFNVKPKAGAYFIDSDINFPVLLAAKDIKEDMVTLSVPATNKKLTPIPYRQFHLTVSQTVKVR